MSVSIVNLPPTSSLGSIQSLPKPITLVLADSHPLIVLGMKQLFASESDFVIVGCCATGDEVLRVVREKRPDVLITEVRLNGTSGLSVHRQILSEGLPTRTIIQTAGLGEADALEALRLGVQGVILKDMPPQHLVRCIRKVHAGSKWVETQSFNLALERILQRESGMQDLAGVLSAREVEIVRLVASGQRNKGVARSLAIAEGTVKAHLHSIYEKLDVHGRTSLTLLAQRKGLV